MPSEPNPRQPTNTMKAIHIPAFTTTYGTLTPSTIPTPTPGPTDLLVHITHASLTFVDLLYARGLHQNNRTLTTPPFTLGHEFAGTVLHTPSSTTSSCPFSTGDRVFGSAQGAFAQLIAVPAASLRPVPLGWTLAEAAAMGSTAPVAYGALVRIARLKAGETVLVHAAAGGLGVMACQIARAVGARVIGTAAGEAKLKVLRDVLGVDAAVDYEQVGWEGRVMEATGGKGVDVVFDTVGLVERSIRLTRYGGRILIVGFAGRGDGGVGELERVAANRILLKGITLHGYRYGEHGRQFPDEIPAIWEGLAALVDKGDIKPVIYARRFRGLEAVPTAMEAMAAREVWGKAVIDIETGVDESKL